MPATIGTMGTTCPRANSPSQTVADASIVLPGANYNACTMTTPSLEQAIRNRTAKVGVIGLGYVGLPLIRAFIAGGMQTMGFDVDRARSISSRPAAATSSTFRPSGSPSTWPTAVRAHRRHAAVVPSPTPADLRADAADRQPRAGPDLHRETRPEQIAAGCGRASWSSWRARPIPAPRETWCCRFSRRGLQAGRDFFLAFSPEREDPGNPNFTRRAIPKVVGGIDAGQRRAGRGCSTARPWSRSCRSRAAKWPRRARSWRTPTARSTSPWSTS